MNVRVGNNVHSIDNLYEKFVNPQVVANILQGKKIGKTANIQDGIKFPPDVKILSPGPGAVQKTDTVKIKVQAKDMGGGIDEIRLYHNEKAVNEESRGIQVLSKKNVLTNSNEVQLVDGKNIFRAVAFSNERNESNLYELIVSLSAPEKEVNLHILAVGINQYKNSSLNLNYAENDAKAIVDFFKRKVTKIFKSVKKKWSCTIKREHNKIF